MTDSTYTSIIWLTQGKYAIVDNEDYELFSLYSWSYGGRYAQRFIHDSAKNNPKHTTLTLHRAIMRTPSGMSTDHINGNTLDNRKVNLRICTQSQNTKNRKAAAGSSKYKGVSWNKLRKKWKAGISANKMVIDLGFFINEEAAAKAYNLAAIKYHGEFARLNEVG